MAQMTNAQLVRRLRELESENAELRSGAAAGRSDVSVIRSSRRWPRTLVATLLIAAGALLAPVAVVATWTRAELTDTDRFVATFATLADDPAVQDFATDQVVAVIAEQVDIPALTAQVIDAITELGTGPAATRALNAMKGPAASGLESLIASTVQRLVTSEAFADVWASALRLSHTQLIAIMQNDSGAVVTIAGDGAIGIQLAPIVEAVKSALLEQGFEIANGIPTIDRTVVVARSDALPTVQFGYVLAVAAGTWLPWISLLLLCSGIAVANRRSRALLWAAVALAFGMALTLIALATGALLFPTIVGPAAIPTDVAGILYRTVVGRMQDTTVAVLVIAVVVAVVGWLAGPYSTPRKLRDLASAGAARIRVAAEAQGITTGRAGSWMYAHRLALRVLVAVTSAGVVLAVRPITPGLVLGTLAVGGLVVAVLEVCQRPPARAANEQARDANMQPEALANAQAAETRMN